MSTPGLIRYEAAVAALAKCLAVDEVKKWLDKSAALQAYARMAKEKTLEIDAAEVRIRAERRLGQMLAEQKESGGMATGAKGVGPIAVVTNDRNPTLADIGVSKDLSSRAQKIAKVPTEQFEAEVAGWRGRVEEEGVRVTARLEAAGAKALDPGAPTDYTEADREAEHAADFASMLNIIEADDKLAAARIELVAARQQLATTQRVADDKAAQVAVMTKEAARWMRKAKKAAACQDCMTALERE